jgi:hypothetical protein
MSDRNFWKPVPGTGISGKYNGMLRTFDNLSLSLANPETGEETLVTISAVLRRKLAEVYKILAIGDEIDVRCIGENKARQGTVKLYSLHLNGTEIFGKTEKIRPTDPFEIEAFFSAPSAAETNELPEGQNE